jgi:putative transposase
MKRARFTEEQIIGVLREHEAGAKTVDLARKPGVSEATLYNGKAKYGGMDAPEAKRLKQLEDENAELKKPLSVPSACEDGAQGCGCAIWPARAGASATGGCSSCCGRRASRPASRAPKRRARRRTVGMLRAPILVEARANARWSLEFVHDQFASGRRFRILNVVDDVTRECLAAIPDTSISGRRWRAS